MTQHSTIPRSYLVALAVASFAGCFASEPPQRGRLSEAVEKASDDNTSGDRRVGTSPSREIDSQSTSTLGTIFDILFGRRDTTEVTRTRVVHAPPRETGPPDTIEVFTNVW